MSPLFAALLLLALLAILAVAAAGEPRGRGSDEMLAAPAIDGRPADDCTTRFYTRVGSDGRTRYCVDDGKLGPKCEALPIAAIVAANEESDAARCSRVVWGFRCNKGLLCGLQQAGPNLVSYETANKIARARCGARRRLSC
jgi:hypothetical protein